MDTIRHITSLVCACLLSFSLLSCGSSTAPSKGELHPFSLSSPTPDRTFADIYVSNPNLTPVEYTSPALLPKTPDLGTAYLDRIVFLCDSPTFWLKPYGLLNQGENTTQVWTGPEGTMTLAYQSTYEIMDPYDRIRRPIREVVRLHKPPYLIISLGINGISFMDEDYFKEEYTDLVRDIQAISPYTTLILQSIYPITPDYMHWGMITNEMITKANRWILEIAEDTHCSYLDTASALMDNNGNGKREWMMGDGLHYLESGMEAVLEYIRTHGCVPFDKLAAILWPDSSFACPLLNTQP